MKINSYIIVYSVFCILKSGYLFIYYGEIFDNESDDNVCVIGYILLYFFAAIKNGLTLSQQHSQYYYNILLKKPIKYNY